MNKLSWLLTNNRNNRSHLLTPHSPAALRSATLSCVSVKTRTFLQLFKWVLCSCKNRETAPEHKHGSCFSLLFWTCYRIQKARNVAAFLFHLSDHMHNPWNTNGVTHHSACIQGPRLSFMLNGRNLGMAFDLLAEGASQFESLLLHCKVTAVHVHLQLYMCYQAARHRHCSRTFVKGIWACWNWCMDWLW